MTVEIFEEAIKENQIKRFATSKVSIFVKR